MTPGRVRSSTRPTSRSLIVIKLGGELLEEKRRLRSLIRSLVQVSKHGPVILIHGGGREIDAEISRLGITKQTVDGLRITDAATLDAVVGVLAGRVNTRLVSEIIAAGGSAVGLTGVDGGIVKVNRARRYKASDGQLMDLGFVGIPGPKGSPELLHDLTAGGYLPVVASIGSDVKGRLYNVNADTLAGDIAVRVGAKRLIILGATAGVLDRAGYTIPTIDDFMLLQLIQEGQASQGMVAKLLACRAARKGGVRHVVIADGRRRGVFQQVTNGSGDMTVISGLKGRRLPTK